MNQHSSAQFRSVDPEAAREMLLEEMANRLLARVAVGPQESYPYYSERALRRAVRRDGNHPVLEAEALPPATGSLQFALRLLTRSHVPPRKRLAFRMLARGYTYRQTARRLEMSTLQVRRWIEEVCQELREESCGPDQEPRRSQDLREVMRADMGRHAYGPERHCRPGQEACRRTGLCSRRWYLHYLSE